MASDRPEIPPLEDLRGHLERELIDQSSVRRGTAAPISTNSRTSGARIS